MSDNSDDNIKSDRQNDKEDGICRDFSRGTCDRKFCKYKHENEIKPLNFCHDFQNNVCPRLHCKFIHCTTEEVELYKRTGEMSNQILAEATRKNQLYGTPPVCHQFRKGLCRRSFCKYRHITKEEEDAEIMELIQNNLQRKFVPNNTSVPNSQLNNPVPCFNNNCNNNNNNNTTNGLHHNRLTETSFDDFNDQCHPPFPKRRFLSTDNELVPNEIFQLSPGFKGYFAGNPPPPILSRVDARTIMLEEENSLLHKEIAQLKRQVSDLTATNEFLLDQNATLRVSNKRNGAVSMPAVTITNTNSPQQVIRTVTASVATVPVSLATVSTCNPVSGNPSISIAGVPSVSIAQPAQILAPSQQILVTTNPSTQLAIANSTPAQLAIASNSQAQLAQAQQLALATTSQAQHMANQQLALANAPQQLNQQLTSQAQQLANQQLTSQAQQLANQQLTSQAQQLANQQLTSQAQQLANQQLTSQAQQLANQQLTSQAQQLALANTQQLTSQAQQLALANSTQQLTVASVPQQLTLAGPNQQLLTQQGQQIELHRTNQITAINTSQAIAMSNASQPMVSYPIMTQSMNHAIPH